MSGSQPEDRGFESRRGHHFFWRRVGHTIDLRNSWGVNFSVAWQEKADNASIFERRKTQIEADKAKKYLQEMLDNFWANYGGYNTIFDPNIVPRAVWPDELVKKYNYQVEKYNKSERDSN